MPAAAARSGDGGNQLRVFLLQPGPGSRRVVFDALGARLAQNGVQEGLTAQWVTHCRERAGAAV